MQFIKLAKYASFLASDPRDQMSYFVSGCRRTYKRCHSSMLHDNMNISLLMVHARSVDKARAQRKSRDAKRARSYEGGFLKNSREIQDKPRFNKWVSSQVP